MGTVGWVVMAAVGAVMMFVLRFFLRVRAYSRQFRPFNVVVSWTERPSLDEARIKEALTVLPGVVLTDIDEKAQCWSATTPDRGEIWLQLKESAEETSGRSVWTLELDRSRDAAATAEADAAELEKLVRLSAAFARHGATQVSIRRYGSSLSRVLGATEERSAPVTPALLEALAAGRLDSFRSPSVFEAPTSIREFFEPGEEVSAQPRTFRVRGPRSLGTACARHYFPTDVRFDWARVVAALSARGWRAATSEPQPGLRLLEFPDLLLEFSGQQRPARVMFEVCGTEVDAPAPDPRLGAQFAELATKLPARVWRFVLYDNNSGFPALLRLQLLREVSRALAEQQAPLMLAWDDAGHLVDPQAFHDGPDDALAASVVAVKVARVNDAPADKACFVTTTGLTDLSLPEVEFIGSMERVDQCLPLLMGTAAQLVQRGPVFADGETVGFDASFAGRLRVKFAKSLEQPERFVMALQ
jgi:hypothetical protein